MSSITVFTVDEYEPQEFDAVLFRESTVVCLRSESDLVRIVPLDKVNHVDGDAESMLVDTEIPDSFYGGASHGFVDMSLFPDLEQHLEELTQETY
jgi:hypothetical protein